MSLVSLCGVKRPLRSKQCHEMGFRRCEIKSKVPNNSALFLCFNFVAGLGFFFFFFGGGGGVFFVVFLFLFYFQITFPFFFFSVLLFHFVFVDEPARWNVECIGARNT